MLLSALVGLILVHETLSSSGRMQDMTNILDLNRQTTSFLQKGESRLFYLLDQEKELHPLSVTITPCSSGIQWSMAYKKNPGIVNDTAILKSVERDSVGGYRGSSIWTVSIAESRRALYMIHVLAVDGPTKIQLFASMDPGGPYDMSLMQDSRLKIAMLRRRRLSVRWDQSAVNPQQTHYCLVVSSKRPYAKLCEAEEESSRDVELMDVRLRRNTAVLTRRPLEPQKLLDNSTSSSQGELAVVCTKHKTHIILYQLAKGTRYYLNLFAINTYSRLTVPYMNSSVLFDPHVKPIVLKDGKPKTVNLKKHEGRVSFRFRVAVHSRDVHLYVLSCGGSVYAQIMHKRQVVEPRTRVNGYARFKISNPRRGDYYSLKISATDADELFRIRSIEAFATQYPRTRYPLPELPPEPDLYEYGSLKGCSSVVVGFVPAPDSTPARYCVLARENHSPPLLGPRPDQCGLEARLKRSSFAAKDCSILATNKTLVTQHTVANLSPGKSYTIQVTVKKNNGRTLSYKLLTVFTKSSCD